MRAAGEVRGRLVLLGATHWARPSTNGIPALDADHARDLLDLYLGDEAAGRYRIIVDDPEKVARHMDRGMKKVRQYRIEMNDAFYFNWLLEIDPSLQIPFEPSHANMSGLELSRDLPLHELACNLRRLFSGIVAGNVKPEGVAAIREHGPYEIHGEAEILASLDELLNDFVRDHRMKLPGKEYVPCYRIIK